MAFYRILASVFLLVLLVTISQAAAVSKRSLFYDSDLPDKRDLTPYELGNNKLFLRLLDAAIADAHERGAPEEEVRDMMRKRNGIRKCFFHAVNCW